MDELSKESKEFIEYVQQVLKDPEKVYATLLSIGEEMGHFLTKLELDPVNTLKRIKDKQVNGAIEHGGVEKQTINNVQDEIEMEIIDLYVWELMKKWLIAKLVSN